MKKIGLIILATGLLGNTSALWASQVCGDVVEVMATRFIFKVANSLLERVEVRQCHPNDSLILQIVAWPSVKGAHPLIVDTDDFGVVQEAARGNVFVIETGGATRNQVFVIVFTHGQPSLALRRTTKGTARLNISESDVILRIEGIYAGDLPPKSETHRFDIRKEQR